MICHQYGGYYGYVNALDRDRLFLSTVIDRFLFISFIKTSQSCDKQLFFYTKS